MEKPKAKIKETILLSPDFNKDDILSNIPPKLIYLAKHELNGDWVVPMQKSDNYILSYIQEGKVVVKVGGKKYKANKGDIFIFKPHQIHEGESVKNYKFTTIGIRIDFADEDFHHKMEKTGWKEINMFSAEDNWKIRQVLDSLIKESEKKERNPTLIKNYLIELFVVINEYIESRLRLKTISKKNSNYKAEVCLKAKEYIEKNYSRKILLKDVAREVSLSPFRFAHIFKEYSGISPIDYVIKTRIDNAKKLLKETDKPITEIAYETGFYDINCFIKIFKRFCKITPSEYRKQ